MFDREPAWRLDVEAVGVQLQLRRRYLESVLVEAPVDLVDSILAVDEETDVERARIEPSGRICAPFIRVKTNP